MKKILVILLLFITLGYSNNKEVILDNAATVIIKVNKKLSYPEAYYLANDVYNMLEEVDLDFSYVMGIIMTESKFNFLATSGCGAIGLMQIMPKTFTSVSEEHGLNYSVKDAYDLHKNIKVGILYLDKLFRKYGHLDYVSASYNGGHRAANNYRSGLYESVPKETMNYISSVKKNKKFFSISFKFPL